MKSWCSNKWDEWFGKGDTSQKTKDTIGDVVSGAEGLVQSATNTVSTATPGAQIAGAAAGIGGALLANSLLKDENGKTSWFKKALALLAGGITTLLTIKYVAPAASNAFNKFQQTPSNNQSKPNSNTPTLS